MSRRLGTEAGQIVDLVDYLRGLIRDYPFGIGLIKELLQNADDAGATRVRFSLDLRTHPDSQLPDERMRGLVGPALLISSDQVFKAKDFDAIQRLQEGHKRAEASSTGRFGRGFNTVYSVTDYPSFVTGSDLLTFDPLREVVTDEVGGTGWRWKLEELWREAPGWPAAFGLTPGVVEIEETIFRLPLRTGPAQCGPSRLGQVPVDLIEMGALLRGVASEWGGCLLLFLRHVLSLELEVISSSGEADDWSATIETTNGAEVSLVRSKVIKAFQDKTVEEVWARYEAEPATLPEILYEHRFAVTVHGREHRVERWLVAQGATFEGRERLLGAAAALRKIREKPLPQIGAACLLPEELGAALPEVKGRMFCTLPLPDTIGLPFHVDAFVDLDSSRRAPTWSEGLVGDELLRMRWNEALLLDLLPRVAGRLLGEVARRAALGELALQAPYQLCPRIGGSRPRWAEAMVTAFLCKFKGVAFVPHLCGEERRVLTVADSRLAPLDWSVALREAVVQDGFEIACPPPADLLRSFKDVKVEFNHITPVDLRQWLHKIEGSSWPSLSKAPLLCLRSDTLLEELLQFCGEQRGASLLNLPLGLRQDGKLLRFGTPGDVTFFGWPAFKSLFPTCPHWFWGSEVERIVRPEQVGGSRMHADLVAINLEIYLSNEEDDWNPVDSEPPNELWLTGLFEYLASKQLTESSLKALCGVALLPGSDGKLHLGGTLSSVVVGIPESIRPGVEKLGWLTVGGGDALQRAVASMAVGHPRVVPRCTGDKVCGLVASAGSPRLALLEDDRLRALVGWIAGEWSEDQDRVKVEVLRAIPIWIAVGGTRIATTDPNVFLATGFDPPAGLPSFRVLELARTEAVRRLRLELGLKELTPEQAASLLGPVLSEEGPEGEGARGWLVRQDSSKWREQTFGWIGEHIRVPDTEGRMRRVTELIDPDDFNGLALVDGLLHAPAEAYRTPGWQRLLGRMGMRCRLTNSDLTELVDRWPRQGRGVETYDGLLKWLDQALERAGRSSDQLEYVKGLARALREKQWVSSASRAALSMEDTRSDKLRAPVGFVDYAWIDLVGQVAPMLPKKVRADLRDALGGVDRPTVGQVVSQLKLSLRQGGPAEVLARYAGELLRWLATAKEVPADVQQEPWIPVGPRRYRPGEVFFEDVRWAGGFLGQAPGTLDVRYKPTLEKVGVTARPGMDALVRLLDELNTAGPTDDRIADIAGHAYQRLDGLHKETSTAWPDASVTGRWPAPSSEGRLRPIRELVVDDAPWLIEPLAKARVPWLAPSISPGFALVLGARRASRAIRQQFSHGVELAAPPGRLQVLKSLVETAAFRSALKRLLSDALQHRGPDEIDAARSRVESTQVRLTAFQTITVKWVLDNQVLVEGPDEVFVQGANDVVTISVSGEPGRWHVLIARGLAEALGYRELFNNAVLEELLGAEPDANLHGLLDRRHIPTDPDKVPAVLPPVPAAGEGQLEGSTPEHSEATEHEGQAGTRSTGEPGDEVHVRSYTRSLPGTHPPTGSPVVGTSSGGGRPTGAQAERNGRPDQHRGRADAAPRPNLPGRSAGVHWVEGHLRRDPERCADTGLRGGPGEGQLPLTAQDTISRELRGARQPLSNQQAVGGGLAAMRGAVQVVPDLEWTPDEAFRDVAKRVGERESAQAQQVEFSGGGTNPDIWITSRSGQRVGVFVCVLTGSWDHEVPKLRASAVPLLHKWGDKAQLWVVEHAGRLTEEQVWKLAGPLGEAYTFRLGRRARGGLRRR